MQRPLSGLAAKHAALEILAGVAFIAIAAPMNIGCAQIMALPPTASLHGLMVPSIVGFRGCQSPRKPEPVRKNPVPRRGTRPCLPKASPHRNVDRAAIVRAFPARHAGRPISLCTASETRQPATGPKFRVRPDTEQPRNMLPNRREPERGLRRPALQCRGLPDPATDHGRRPVPIHL